MPRAKLGGDSNRGHGGVDGAPTKSTAATDDAPAAPGHLGALSTLFFAEMWERFSYYGMRALLTLFMVAPADAGGLAFATADAALVYGNYTMAVYLLAIPGGFIADRLLGARASVLVGGAIIAAGHFALAVPHIAGFYIGLMLVALGTGPFKPAISSLVGSLYTREDPRRDAGFSIFYMGINLGALIAPLVTGYLAQNATFKSWLAANGFDPAHSWHWGFGAAGIGMSFALAVLWMRRDRLPGPPADLAEERAGAYRQGAAVLAASAILLSGLLLSDLDGFRWLRYVLVGLPLLAVALLVRREDLEARRIAAVFVLFFAAMIFWSAFEQAGLTIALFAERLTDNSLGGFDIPSAWYQSLNPLFVVLLAPLFALAWTRLGPRQPTTPVKFALGLVLLSLSFALMVPAAWATATGRISPLWLVGLFLLQTMGELCLSPVGLAAMTRLAPPRLVGLVLGIWFLASAFGNKLAGVLGASFVSDDPQQLASFFWQLCAMSAVAAVVLVALTPWLKRLMGGMR